MPSPIIEQDVEIEEYRPDADNPYAQISFCAVREETTVKQATSEIPCHF